jgi:hypothetical protein
MCPSLFSHAMTSSWQSASTTMCVQPNNSAISRSLICHICGI